MRRLLKPATLGIATFLTAQMAFSLPCENEVFDTFTKLEACITLENLVGHLRAFQQHADNNTDLPGTRALGTVGYNLSRDYIIQKLSQAGYHITLQEVPIKITYIIKPSYFALKWPQEKTFVDGVDYAPIVGSGGGEITSYVQSLPNKYGCEASDYASFKKGNVALLDVGGECHTRTKVNLAKAAGASAVILGNTVPNVYYMGLTPTPSETTPVLLVSSEVSKTLKRYGDVGNWPTVHIKFESVIQETHSQNIFAETISGDPNHIVMVGAHLDSSFGNAGSNDNASAAATILETALLLQKTQPVNKIRFAWWTGEELGLLGSNYYVEHLPLEEKNKIKQYLNYEILGAPNGGRMIMGYADKITPRGSEKITTVYRNYFKSRGLKYYIFDPKIGQAARRSDMFAFMNAGIPVGYLVTGAELTWNPMLSAVFTDLPNRVNGVATHPCYHQICDKLTWHEGSLNDPNYDFNLYLQMSRAAAYAVWSYAMNQDID